MRLAILSWEYPPRRVGEIADHVEELASRLSQSGVKVEVVTYHESIIGLESAAENLKIHRVKAPVSPCINIVTWVLPLSAELQRVTSDAIYSGGAIDLIDAHEWHTIPAAVCLKKAFGIPFIYTVYSLEERRSPSPENPLSMSIKSVEWLGGYEAEIIVARSKMVESDLLRIHRVPPSKLLTISPASPEWIQETMQVYRRVAEAG